MPVMPYILSGAAHSVINQSIIVRRTIIKFSHSMSETTLLSPLGVSAFVQCSVRGPALQVQPSDDAKTNVQVFAIIRLCNANIYIVQLT